MKSEIRIEEDGMEGVKEREVEEDERTTKEEEEDEQEKGEKEEEEEERGRLLEASDALFEAELLPLCFVSTSCLCWLHLLLVVLPLRRLSTGRRSSLN